MQELPDNLLGQVEVLSILLQEHSHPNRGLGLDSDQNGVRTPAAAQLQGHLRGVGQEKLLTSGCFETRLEDPLVGLGGNGDIEKSRRVLAGLAEMGRTRDKASYAVSRHLKAGRMEKAANLVQVVAANMTPARFRSQGLQELLDGDKPLGVQDQPEFVRPMTEEVGEDLGQIFQLPGQTSHGRDTGKVTLFSLICNDFLMNL